jgi:hypothetical protein
VAHTCQAGCPILAVCARVEFLIFVLVILSLAESIQGKRRCFRRGGADRKTKEAGTELTLPLKLNYRFSWPAGQV